MTDLVSLSGLARSLAIYRSRPWRIGQFARFYRQFVSPGDLAFDVGAHVGNRSLALQRAGARVVALEPQRLFYRFLTATMPGQVTVLPLAAGSHPSTGEMAVSRRHPTVSSVASSFRETVARNSAFAGVAWDRVEQVDIVTLDSLITDYGVPTLVKIDVEGHEAEVLAGLSVPVATIVFEYLPAAPDAALASVERIARLGSYRFNLVCGERLAFDGDWMDRAEMERRLSLMSPAERSGDIYARRSDA